ncbi:DNA ligase D [Paracidovorax wautersii]|uniref:DNA ligase (ATP) n=1 Tax=Paracidovorax wautersii TaxID=1177982 RepID=A0ABU1IGA4_9BURK|nr:DNA ligase D [Paracidovorax wautersii]MDR6215588.1 bifunctional non-homologous end joining protein LigD [Paracidovorax wautersii]
MADDALALYRKKRNFAVTPEPAEGGTPGAQALQYVIQKHWASRLHYDLRLELEGTMKSWAVPKGPSFDPADKRMAVQVEDHPIAYNTFEGRIPAKQYGAGQVIVWDRGYWVPEGDPVRGYAEGKLKFTVHGHKLKGRWTLVRMRGRGKDSERQPPWLLIKEHDGLERPAAEFSVVDEMPDSVSALPPVLPPAGGPVARAHPRRTAKDLDAAPAKALPDTLAPQLATLVDGPPAEVADWLWELKFDGYRMLARLERGQVRLVTRNGHDWTARMPQLAKALRKLPLRAGWIDGEVLVMDEHGVPDFQALQNAFDASATAELVYYVFDMPYADGRDLRSMPLVERRELLRTVVQQGGLQNVRFSEAFEARPGDLVASACQLGFEGVIGKRKDAPYATARRNADWIKLKCSHRQEFVILGFTDPKGSRKGIGALLLGVHGPDGELRYAGNVGTGFSERTLADLRERLETLRTRSAPWRGEPPAGTRGAHWVKPQLLAEVSFAEWTRQNRIRHAVFHGLRDDKPAKAIVREKPAALEQRRSADDAAETLPSSLRVSHPERVIDPSTGITKIDLVRYYATVAELMMPHLKDRPVALVRAPDGVKGSLFFQKHMEKAALEGVAQLDPVLDPGHAALMAVAQPVGLLSAAQMNVVEFHTWNGRKDRIERPDRMTFDLDPGEGVAWERVQEAAQLVRTLLTELGLPAYLKTSGGKGLHVVVPIKRLHGWDAVKGFSQAVVQHLARTIPQRFVAKSGPRNRVGKIFVDYLRNGRGATTVSAWSARSRPGMGISVPVAWSELGQLTSGAHWTVQSAGDRLRQGNAPWDGYAEAAVSLTPAMKALDYPSAKTGRR